MASLTILPPFHIFHVNPPEWLSSSSRRSVPSCSTFFSATSTTPMCAASYVQTSALILNSFHIRGLFINVIIIFGGFHFRPPMYWEYIVYSQYMAGRKLKALIPAKNDDIIYEQPLIYYSSQDRQYLLLVAADTPGQNMTQFIPEVSKCCFFCNKWRI